MKELDMQEYVLESCVARPKGWQVAKPNVSGVALVFEGGGFRAAYTAGMANVLLERGIYFPEVCGLSAGASHSVDYLSQDQARVRRAFIDPARSSKGGGLTSLAQGNGFINGDYDYLGCVADGYMPFDWDAFVSNPAQVRIQAFEGDSGRSIAFTRESMDSFEHMMLCVRASSTLPIMMHPVRINGHVMFDGGLGVGAGIPAHLALADGYERLFFVATRPAGYRKEPPSTFMRQVWHRFGERFPEVERALLTRHERYNAAVERLERMEREGRALVVRPDEMPVSSTTMDVAALYDAYERGHVQAIRDLPIWESFLFG